MTEFTLAELQEIAIDVIGDDDIVLEPGMTANDVPGWDSLNHTLICLEIAAKTSRVVDAYTMAQAKDFRGLVALVCAL